MFKAHLMEAAATGIFQVTDGTEAPASQLTELDSRLFDKSFVDLLYLFCNGNGAKQKKKKIWTLWSNSLSFVLHLLQPVPQTFGRSFPGGPGGKGQCLDKVGFFLERKAILMGSG